MGNPFHERAAATDDEPRRSSESETSRDKRVAVMRIALVWSVMLFVITITAAAAMLLVAPLLLQLVFPNARVMILAFRCTPILFPLIWICGTVAAHRRHHSWRVDALLVLIGGVLWFVFPILIYLVTLAFAGGWSVGK